MTTKILLREDEIPNRWYNVQADLPNPLPPVYSPRTLKPVEPHELLPLFPGSLLEQEMSTERWISIPEEVLNIYALWRPTPLCRAHRLEEALGVKSHIYYKNEGVSPAGSHKPNTAIAQAYYNKREGIRRLATETGAGQWGSALSLACNYFGLSCTIYMVRVSFQQKPYRRALMETWGGEVFASPSDMTQSGRSYLEKDPNHPGSLGIAISEAVEDAATHDDTHYSLGSVLNHVCLHQTVIGLEVKRQLEVAGENPDVLIGCVGGGSNFAGFALPFLPDKLSGKAIRMVAVEPTSCPTLTKGVYAYDYGDSTRLGPIAKMYTLGHDFVPPGIHAGGLRYHGDSPIVSQLVKEGIVEATALGQIEVFQAAMLFARTEGIVPAPESAHAIQAAIREAQDAEKQGERKTIVFNLSGHGHFDMGAYDSYLGGKLEDFDYPEAKVREAMRNLPQISEVG